MAGFDHGSTINIAVSFLTAAGEPANVPSATLWLNYRTAEGVMATEEIDLQLVEGKWVTQWDSRLAMAGTVKGHVRSAETVVPIIATHLQFALRGSAAEPPVEPPILP